MVRQRYPGHLELRPDHPGRARGDHRGERGAVRQPGDLLPQAGGAPPGQGGGGAFPGVAGVGVRRPVRRKLSRPGSVRSRRPTGAWIGSDRPRPQAACGRSDPTTLAVEAPSIPGFVGTRQPGSVTLPRSVLKEPCPRFRGLVRQTWRPLIARRPLAAEDGQRTTTYVWVGASPPETWWGGAKTQGTDATPRGRRRAQPGRDPDAPARLDGIQSPPIRSAAHERRSQGPDRPESDRRGDGVRPPSPWADGRAGRRRGHRLRPGRRPGPGRGGGRAARRPGQAPGARASSTATCTSWAAAGKGATPPGPRSWCSATSPPPG